MRRKALRNFGPTGISRRHLGRRAADSHHRPRPDLAGRADPPAERIITAMVVWSQRGIPLRDELVVDKSLPRAYGDDTTSSQSM
jgi:hypothetical protein